MCCSTPGALKVQGLAARKVTTGSPLNSCKLLAGFGQAERRGSKGYGVCLSEGSLNKTLF